MTQVRVIEGWVDQSHRADIKVIGEKVFGRWLFKGCLFAGREFGVKLLCDSLSNLALDRKNIGQIAFIALSPDVGVSPGIDELSIQTNPPAGLAHAALQEIRDMKRPPDLLRVPLAAVFHHARSADYFQVRDSCQAAQDFAVHPISECSVRFV